MAEFTDFGIVVAIFLAGSVIAGSMMWKLVQRSGRRLIVAGRSLPLFLVGTMLAAQSIDGNSSLGNMALVWEFGFYAGAVLPIGLGVCLLLVGIFYAKRLNFMQMFTLPDFYFRRFGNGAEGISSVLMIISFIILVAGNLAAAGLICELVFGVSYIWGLLIVATVVLVYTFCGGLFSCAATDLFQVHIAIVAFWAAFIFFAGGYADTPWAEISDSFPEGTMDLSALYAIENGALLNWAALFALGLGDVIALDFMERVFAAKNPKVARRGALWGGGLTLFTVIPTSMLGMIAMFYLPSLEDPGMAMPLLAMEHMPFAIGAAMLIGVLGAGMSTANGGLLGISAVISRNLIQRVIRRRWLKREAWDDNKLLWITRITVIPMFGVGVLLAWVAPNPGFYLILAFDVVFAGAWAPLTLGLFWKKSNMPAAVVALLVGSGIRLLFWIDMEVWGYLPAEYAGLDSMIPPVIAFFLFIAVALATQKNYPGKERHDVRDYAPPVEDVIAGEDLRGFKPGPQTSTPA